MQTIYEYVSRMKAVKPPRHENNVDKIFPLALHCERPYAPRLESCGKRGVKPFSLPPPKLKLFISVYNVSFLYPSPKGTLTELTDNCNGVFQYRI